MKKKLLALCLLVACVFSAAIGTVTAFAAVSLEACDECFQTTVNGFLERDDVEGNKITAERTPVYDIWLQHLGYVYEFEIAAGEGYAIIICDDGNYIAQEFVPSAQSPYAQVGENELCVYVTNATYLKHNGENFCDIATSEALPQEAITALAEYAIKYKTDNYTGSDERITVTVNYTSRSFEGNSLAKVIPCYTNPGGMVGACAAVAGTNILGFYDRYYDNLIPNFTAGKESYGFYLYNPANDAVYDSMRQLFSLMGGNGSGITESGFTSGLQQYCTQKNLSCDLTQLKSGGKLSFSAVKQSIDENKPVALLLSTYTICTFYNDDNHDEFLYDVYSGNHVMVGMGYYKVNYTLTDGSSSTYEFIYVSSGFGMFMDAYFNMNYKTNINSAYKVYIH